MEDHKHESNPPAQTHSFLVQIGRGAGYALFAILMAGLIFFGFDLHKHHMARDRINAPLREFRHLDAILGNGEKAALNTLCDKLREGRMLSLYLGLVGKKIPEAGVTPDERVENEQETAIACADWIERHLGLLEFAPEKGVYELVTSGP